MITIPVDYYPWLNDSNKHHNLNNNLNNSSSASLTPVESSAYSTTSLSPALILKAMPLSQSITQATASTTSSAALSSQIQSTSTLNKKLNYENLLSTSYQYSNPFPVSSSHKTDSHANNHNHHNNSDTQKQMFQLNSSSSLTLVSKAPSMSYCYINNDNNSSSNDIFAKVGTEPFNLETARTSVLTGTISSTASSSSTSSSGCSSLENNNNQYFSKIITNEKPLQFPTSFLSESIKERNTNENSSFILPNQQRTTTDSLSRQLFQKNTSINTKKIQQLSTYKPLLKSSEQINNNDTCNNNKQQLQAIKLNNKYTPLNATKGDFV